MLGTQKFIFPVKVSKILLLLIILSISIIILSACGPAGTQVQPTSTALPLDLPSESPLPTVAGYPAPESVEVPVEASYPGPAVDPTPLPSGYPANDGEFLEPRFRFNGPLAAGVTLVEGQAPPNLSLSLVDVTFSGVVLGSGRSDENGRFSFGVQPLPEGHRIGITFSELENGMSYGEMSEKYFPYRGEEFMNIPNVGILFDTILVES
jgi:hypothetical protein